MSLLPILTGVAVDEATCRTPVRANCVTIATFVTAALATADPNERNKPIAHSFSQFVVEVVFITYSLGTNWGNSSEDGSRLCSAGRVGLEMFRRVVSHYQEK